MKLKTLDENLGQKLKADSARRRSAGLKLFLSVVVILVAIIVAAFF